jgi:hypothetical protein
MTQATMARPHAPRRTLPPLSVIAFFVVGALLFATMAYAVRSPTFIARVTVENPGPMVVDVDVRPSPHGASLSLASVPADSAASTYDVIDQGDQWVFRFSSGGIDGGALHVSRTKLAADGWRVVVPRDVIARLQAGD